MGVVRLSVYVPWRPSGDFDFGRRNDPHHKTPDGALPSAGACLRRKDARPEVARRAIDAPIPAKLLAKA